VTRIRFFRMSLVLMIVLAGTGVFGSCSDVCGCPPVLPPSQIIGRVIDESGAGVGGTELKARVGAGFAMSQQPFWSDLWLVQYRMVRLREPHRIRRGTGLPTRTGSLIPR
jgi:hypothetical protein